MTRSYSAGASRRTAVLTALVSMHLGVYLLVASAIGPRLAKPRQADPPAVTLVPPIEKPPAVVRPEPLLPPEAYGERVLEPDVFVPVIADQAPAEPMTQWQAAGAGVAEPDRAAEITAPRLRMQGERLAALVNACYPAQSRRLGEEGRAVVRLRVASDGSVRSWSLVQGTGFPRLDAAIDCIVARLLIDPGRQDGRAVESDALLPIVFRLD